MSENNQNDNNANEALAAGLSAEPAANCSEQCTALAQELNRLSECALATFKANKYTPEEIANATSAHFLQVHASLLEIQRAHWMETAALEAKIETLSAAAATIPDHA